MKRNLTFALLTAAALGVAATASAFPGGGRPRPPSFEELDADGSGSISAEEFAAPLLEHYAELDADGDGVVTAEEFMVRSTERFTELDTDGDGTLTEAELRAGRPGRRG